MGAGNSLAISTFFIATPSSSLAAAETGDNSMSTQHSVHLVKTALGTSLALIVIFVLSFSSAASAVAQDSTELPFRWQGQMAPA
jgi:hypothetical protein